MTEATPDQIKSHVLADLDALIALSTTIERAAGDARFAADEVVDAQVLAAAVSARDSALAASVSDKKALVAATADANALRTEVNRLKALYEPVVVPTPTPTPVPTPTPTPTPTPVPSGWPATPTGYVRHKLYDLAKDEGWTKESGAPSNAVGVDRPANVQFGKGPNGKSALILGNRDSAGGTFFTADAKALFAPIPNYHRTRVVVSFDTMSVGMWPAVWERPVSGDGEIDIWEKFGGHGAPFNNYPIDAGTLHTSPYDSTHKQLARTFKPNLTSNVNHVLETELKPGLFSWWVDGVLMGTISQAQFDTAAGRSAWAPMFGNAAKKWYLRLTLQAGGSEGGPVPANLNKWQFFVHEAAIWIPA